MTKQGRSGIPERPLILVVKCVSDLNAGSVSDYRVFAGFDTERCFQLIVVNTRTVLQVKYFLIHTCGVIAFLRYHYPAAHVADDPLGCAAFRKCNFYREAAI